MKIKTNQFRCYIIGEGSVPLQCADLLLQREQQILGIISPDPTVCLWAEKHQLPAHNVRNLSRSAFTAQVTAVLQQQPFDYLFSIVNPFILPDVILTLPQQYAINYHYGPLPKYAGMYATSWALINREPQHGITWHVMTNVADAGDILKQSFIDVAPDDTTVTLNAKCYEAAVTDFGELIDELAHDQYMPVPQNLAERTYFLSTDRPSAGAVLSWQQDAAEIDALCRALTFGPYPNPLTLSKIALGDDPNDPDLFLVDELMLDDDTTVIKPSVVTVAGTLLAIEQDEAQQVTLRVAARRGAVKITKLRTIDGQSAPITDLIDQYDLVVGKQLPELAGEIVDAITTQYQRIVRHESFWRRRLETLQPLELPYRQGRVGSADPSRVVTLPITLPERILEFLDHCAWSSDHFLFTLFAVYLARLSEVESFDLAFTTPSLAQGLEKCFAAQIPLRVTIDREWSFAQAYHALADERALCTQKQTFARDLLARYPTVDAKLENHLGLTVGVTISEEAVAIPAALDGLMLYTTHQAPNRQLSTSTGHHAFIAYNPAQFMPEQIDRVVGHWQTLMTALMLDPEQPIKMLPLLTAAEHRQLLVEFQQNKTAYHPNQSIHHIFEAQAVRTPDAVAVTFAGEQLTYQELNRRANQIAHFLLQQGIGPDELVGLCIERSFEMVIGLLGILKAGGAYVPLDPTYPPDRIQFMLEDANLSIVLASENTRAILAKCDISAVTLSDLLSQAERQETSDNPQSSVTAENLAYVLFTSGSTGRPKAVAQPHRTLCNLVEWQRQESDGSGRTLQFAPINFDVSAQEIFTTLSVGGTLVLLDAEIRRDPFALLRYLHEQAINRLFIPFTTLQQLADVAKGEMPPTLHEVYQAGEQLQITATIAAWFRDTECLLINHYGPTESHVVTRHRLPKDVDLWPTLPPIGRTVPNTDLYILDGQQQLVPIGVPGQLYIGARQVARGYLNQPELTQSRFVHGSFSSSADLLRRTEQILYKTGDLCRYLPDGEIEFLGRIDTQVKLRGFRLELGEVETVLANHPVVKDAVVVVNTEEGGAQRLVGYVVVNDPADNDPDVTQTPANLRSYLSQKLPDYMVPDLIALVDELPMTPSGKIDRKALAQRSVAAELRAQVQATYVTAQTNLQQQLVNIWQEALHVEQVGIYDNFFELGGNSLSLVTVQSHLNQLLPRALTTVELFRYPTIHALCTYLEPSAAQASDHQRLQKDKPTVQSARTQQAADDQAIAIIGLAGRFPGAKSVQELWENLINGVEAITFYSNEELLANGVSTEALADPAYVKAGAFLDELEQFDAEFFGFSPRDAKLLNPQVRQFLECGWEALEHANCVPASYPGAIGVYAGGSENYYVQHHVQPAIDVTSPANYYQTFTANEKDYLGTRLAYKLNLTGPALTVQTACSTSLVAVHMACRALHLGECDVALAGGVGIYALERTGYHYQEGMIFSPDGHCRAFDVASSGTVAGNGVGFVVLKRLQEALADGDIIHAVIKGSAINNDGSQKVGYTAPSVDGQRKVIQQALANANVDPATIGYVETHGTGTKLGDPIELTALKEAFQARQPEANTHRSDLPKVVLGAIKTNIGHLGTAAGVVGLIKSALILKHKVIPPTLHFTAPNPELNFPSDLFAINTEVIPWQIDENAVTNGAYIPRRAGVSSFGIGGTNAHVVLEEAPSQLNPQRANSPQENAQNHGESTHHLLTLSAKNAVALRAMAATYADFLAAVDPITGDVSTVAAPFADICYTTHVGRTHFDHRLSVVSASREALQRQLRAYIENNNADATTLDRTMAQGVVDQSRQHPKVAFLFTGQGAQYIGMGRELYESEPLFRAVLDRCDKAFQACYDRSLIELLYPTEIPTHNDLLESHPCGQAVNFTLECALADLWRAWGVQPDFVFGHSLGDFAAAYTAGVISLEDGLRLVTKRGQLMETALGSMVSVMASEVEVTPFLADYTGVTIGVINGHKSVVISGESEQVDAVVKALNRAGYKTRLLAIPVAAHSPMLDPVLDEFAETVRGLTLAPPKLPVVSSMTGKLLAAGNEELTSPDYWRQHLRNTVRFADGLQTLHDLGCTIYLEVGPQSTLLGIARQMLDVVSEAQNGEQQSAYHQPCMLPSLHEKYADSQQMLHSLGQLYVHGLPIDWQAVAQHHQRRKVELPLYPFQHQRYWFERVEAREQRAGLRPLLDQRIDLPSLNTTIFETRFSAQKQPFLTDHYVFGEMVTPGACYLTMLSDAAELLFGGACVVEDLVLPAPMVVPEGAERVVQLIVTQNQSHDADGAHEFTVVSFDANDPQRQTTLHASGQIRPALSTVEAGHRFPVLAELRQRCTVAVDIDARYQMLDAVGIELGPTLRWLQDVHSGEGELIGRLHMPAVLDTVDQESIHPGIFDSCLMAGLALRPASAEVALPFAAKRIRFYQTIHSGDWWCYARQVDEKSWDIQLCNQFGDVVVDIEAFQVRKATSATIRQQTDAWQNRFYAIEWQPLELPVKVATSGQAESTAPATNGKGDQRTTAENDKQWLIFADTQGASEALATALQQNAAGCKQAVIFVRIGANFQQIDEHNFVIRPDQVDDYRRLLERIPEVTDVLHCWSFDHIRTAPGTDTEQQDIAAFQQALTLSCGTTLHWVQTLLNDHRTPPNLWLLTCGAQATENGQATGLDAVEYVSGFVHATLWGMGKTIMLEHPELNCVCIDLDETSALPEQMVTLSTILTGAHRFGQGEHQFAIRDGRCKVARLKEYSARSPHPLGEAEAQLTPTIDANASYLLTGGLGGLGLAIAHWLVAQGAKYLILLGRSEPSATVQEKIDGMRTMGAQIQAVQADVCDEIQIATLLDAIPPAYPLRGIIHAAGVLHDGAILSQTWPRFMQTLAPKVYGTWHLHRLTKELPLDFFVLFSSIAGLLGNRGQANHAAANAFLDAFAHHRHALGLPALSINWGGWQQIGVAAPIFAQLNLSGNDANGGDRGLLPEEGVAAFAALLGQPTPQIACMAMDWHGYLGKLGSETAIPPFYRALPQLSAPAKLWQGHATEHDSRAMGSTSPMTFVTQLESQPAEKRMAVLIAKLQIEVARIVGVDAPEQIDTRQGIMDMGIDSLTAVEFRNRVSKLIAQRLPATLVFDYPTLRRMATYILQTFFLADASSPAAAQDPTTTEQNGMFAVDEVFAVELSTDSATNGDLSNEQMLELLAKELDEIGL